MIKKSDLLNLNADWRGVMGLPVDLAFFMTNVTNEARIVFPTQSWGTFGGDGGHVNEPRTWGLRVKYRFGGE
jgi:iron complex outermembrane receptor protein